MNPARPASIPPTARSSLRSGAFLMIFALANVGGVIAYMPLLTLLLPLRIEALSGDARIGVISACVTAGAVAASLSNILFGWLSDRSVRSGGGRRGWMAAGVVLTAISYAGVELARTPVEIVAAIVAFQFAVNALLAPMMPIMAEEIPDAQKGLAGGFLALASPAASAVSATLVTATFLPDASRFAIVALIASVCVTPLILSRRRTIAVGSVAADPLAVTPMPPRRDLVIAGCARLLVQIAGVVAQGYLLYYFESILPGADRRALPAQVGQLLTIAFIVPLPLALLMGRLSDRTGRRKPFLLLAAGIAATGLIGMAVATDWRGGAIAFTVYAAGSAVFAALHSAFAMQLLPDPEWRGRDLGLFNLANTLPSLVGPALAWTLATPSDFGTVMVALAGLTLCGGLGMLGVRAWR